MTDRVLEAFLRKHPELAKTMLAEASGMWMIATEDGRIHWANASFIRFIGYSMYEFALSSNNITWQDISAKDGTLVAEEAQLADCAAGNTAEYWIRKIYIPKGDAPVPVKLHVRRYPRDGSHEFFVIEITILDVSENATLLRQVVDKQREMRDVTTDTANETNSKLEKLIQLQILANARGFWAFVERMELQVAKRPKTVGVVLTAAVALVGGKQTITMWLEALIK